MLGHPDGKYCQYRFWAEYDYCVGVSDNFQFESIGEANALAMLAGKTYTTLPGDGAPSDYVIGDINCTDLSGEFYQECWQKLNMNSWLPNWHREEPRCVNRQKSRGCSINFPGTSDVEPWTATLLREYVGAGGTDCTVLPGACSFVPNPDLGTGIPTLAWARYRYLHYNIIGTANVFCPSFLSNNTNSCSHL